MPDDTTGYGCRTVPGAPPSALPRCGDRSTGARPAFTPGAGCCEPCDEENRRPSRGRRSGRAADSCPETSGNDWRVRTADERRRPVPARAVGVQGHGRRSSKRYSPACRRGSRDRSGGSGLERRARSSVSGAYQESEARRERSPRSRGSSAFLRTRASALFSSIAGRRFDCGPHHLSASGSRKTCAGPLEPGDRRQPRQPCRESLWAPPSGTGTRSHAASIQATSSCSLCRREYVGADRGREPD